MTLYQARQSTSLSNNTTKTVDLTIPNGKIWKIYAINMHNGDDVNRLCSVKIVDSSGNLLHNLAYTTINAGSIMEMLSFIKTSISDNAPFISTPTLIKGGNKLRLTWNAGGTSSGGTSYYTITYQEVPE